MKSPYVKLKLFASLLAAILFSGTAMVRSQEMPLYFQHLTYRDGLASNKVSAIFQDAYGFMWFGTDKGLCKYDGYSVTTYRAYAHNKKKERNLPVLDLHVTGFYQPPTNPRILYFSTKYHLFKFDIITEKFTSVHIPPMIRDSHSAINGIAAGSDGTLWLSTVKGIASIDTTHKESQFYWSPEMIKSKTSDVQVWAILPDSNGNIWVGTTSNLLRFHARTATWETVHLKNVPSPVSIRAIKKDQQGNLWLATYGKGLVKYSPRTGQTSVLRKEKSSPENRLNFQTSLLIAHNGEIWAGTFGLGIIRFNPENKILRIYQAGNNLISGLTSNNIFTIYQDRSGCIWFATYDQGINKVSLPRISFMNLRLSSIKPQHRHRTLFIAAVSTEKGDIYVANYKLGLFKVKAGNDFNLILEPVRPMGSGQLLTHILSMRKDNSLPIIWIGTSEGLWKFNYLRNTIEKIHFAHLKTNRVNTIYQNKNGYLWFAINRNSLILFNPLTNRITRYFNFENQQEKKEAKKPIQKIFSDSKGNIWVAFKNKLARFHPEKSSFEFYTADSIFSPYNSIHSVLASENGTIWIGTRNGLLKFDPEKGVYQKIKDYPELNRLTINSMLEDDSHRLWLGTKNGLFLLNPTTKYLRKYSQLDGLSIANFLLNSAARLSNGMLVFGTSETLVLFRPVPETKHFKLLVSNFEIFASSHSTLGKDKKKRIIFQPAQFTFPYDNYSFNIEFGLTDYSFPERNRFMYKLEGMDNVWHSLGMRHQLNLINLPAKRYRLLLKGSNYYGQWSEQPLQISFQILPPFWQTWWFRISAGILVVALTWLAYSLRVHTIRRRNLFLEEMNTQLNNQVRFRKQVEKLLRESETKYRTLVESIKESIYSLDSDGIFTFMNETAAERLGGQPGDFVGKSLWEAVPKVYADPMYREVKDVITSGKGKTLDVDIVLNGEKRYFHISIQPIPSETGFAPQALSVATETTERITLEERLRQAQKMEAIGKLAGGIAHDFNNLLSIIRGYTYLLLEDYQSDGELHESLQEIDRASERAHNLTRQLLAFSRRQLLKPQVMDLNQQIHEMGKMLRRLIGENIELEILTDENLCPIFADPGQINQIIMNLVVNARDAMPKGGVLTIRTQAIHGKEHTSSLPFEATHKNYAMLTVQDTGIGMDQETLGKIFDPFFTTKEKGKGTGLGLSTVFGIVKQSNGYIWVDSAPGKGSSFNIYFPCAETQTIPETPIETVKNQFSGNEQILLVEDEVSLNRMVSTMLKRYGYRVRQAFNAEEALAIYRKENRQIDLIITDVVMPGMNGIEMMEELTAQYGDIRVIYMSGYTDNEMIQHGLMEQGLHFLQKPFTPEQITKKIREIMDGVKSQASN